MRASWRTGSRRMTRMKTLACSVCLILVGVAPVAADTNNTNAPKSLRMRTRAQPTSHWSPMHWGSKRVAQAAPDPAPAGADQPPADGSAPPAADAPPPAPAPAAAPATVDTTPNLSDEELKKLAEQ